MATQLADPPHEQAPAPAAPGPEATAPAPQPAAGACEKCGARMSPGQDWCLQCGAGAPGSMSGGGWRGLAGVLAATAVLVLGAAAAGYAALSKKTPRTPVVTRTVAQATPPATSAPVVPTTPAPVTPLTKPPKIPLTASTPKTSPTTPIVTTPTTTPTTTPSGSNTGGSNASEEKQPEALLLDTNAASTYNPYNYPAEWFGDPSLAIDGDNTTGWSAQVNPASAPNLAEGLVIDLKSSHRLTAVKLITGTPGMNVQVYGSAAKTLPASIVDPAWVPISHLVVVKKRHARIGLRNKSKAYRFLALWISRAPASSVGTPQAPGKVTVDELELLPAK
ncbi:MAG TPA: discoidin domain-containing protein [Solirubrobacteraceae bacterium]|nr:discoidin domain-containing protein [Solirubrobacteraceae bacterium]